MSDDNGNTTSGEYEDEIAMLRDLCCRQSARIERLTAEVSLLTDKNTQLIAKNTQLRVAWRNAIKALEGEQ